MALPDAHFDPDSPATGDTLFGLPHTVEEAAVVVIPVPFEATTSYRRGTAGGPEAVRAASGQVDLHDSETGEPWRAGVAMEPLDPRIAAWDGAASADARAVFAAGGLDPDDPDPEIAARCARVDALSEQVNALVRERTEAVFARGAIPAILGGDHSVPFGALEAAAARHPGLGILHVDAHADLRRAYEGFTWSHASIFYNVMTRIDGIGALTQVAVRDLGRAETAMAEADPRIAQWLDTRVGWLVEGGEPWGRIAHRIVQTLPERVWVSFDIDGLDPTLCPSTGTPVPGGLSWRETLALLRVLGESGRRIVGFDLCEVAPGDDEWDAAVGARLLYKLAGWAIHTLQEAR